MAGVDVGGFGVLSWSYQIEFRSSTLETALIPQITSTHGSAKSLLPGPRNVNCSRIGMDWGFALLPRQNKAIAENVHPWEATEGREVAKIIDFKVSQGCL